MTGLYRDRNKKSTGKTKQPTVKRKATLSESLCNAMNKERGIKICKSSGIYDRCDSCKLNPPKEIPVYY